MDAAGGEAGKPRFVRLYFHPHDIRALCDTLREKWYHVSEPQATDYGTVEAHLTGPDRYMIRFSTVAGVIRMDLLDRFLGHDAWTTRQLLLLCRPLSDEQLDREFDIAHRTVRATLLHMIRNVEVWTDLMAGGAVRGAGGRSVAELTERLDRAAADLAKVARAVADRGGWDERFVDTLDKPPREKTYGGGIAHLITHSMHHRAQLLYMLRRLGVEGLPEGDVLSWENSVNKG